MNVANIDGHLRSLLCSLPFFSSLWASLCIRLTDYSAQLCGYRSTRQMDDSRVKDVDEIYSNLLNTLTSQINECIQYLDEAHFYKEEIYDLDSDSLERLLEDALFKMTINNCRFIFKEMMFK